MPSLVIRKAIILVFLCLIVPVSGCVSVRTTDTNRPFETPDTTILTQQSDRLKTHRLPDATDLKRDWKHFHQSGRDVPWTVTGDFNGDEERDYAYLLPTKSSDGFSLVAFVSGDTGYEEYILTELTEPVYCCGIQRQPSGTHPVLSTERYRSDGEESATVELPYSAIEFIYFEASSRLYYWDPDRTAFRTAWTSD